MDNKTKWLILGAGPAGLSFANKLKKLGVTSFVVLEKEKEAGGLCRSVEVDQSPFDIGGGHFLDIRLRDVNQFLFEFMPEDEWNLYERNSRIDLNGRMINSPIEANIWQLPIEEQIEYLKKIAVAGCNLGLPVPESFVEWIRWKLGDKITLDYMIPYNQKMFGDELNELGTYWLDKLPDVSFEETLRSCLTHKAYGSQPGHAHFYYPKKYGYGELWKRMGENIQTNIIYGAEVQRLHFIDKTVHTADGTKYRADIIINTIPWMEFEELLGMPKNIVDSIHCLKYSSIETRYFGDRLDTDAQWIYYPTPELPYHRILVRQNFCPKSKGYWTETRRERTVLFPEEEQGNFCYLNKYAYPLNTINKVHVMKQLLEWCEKYGVYGLGRWGEHQHYNSDVTVGKALELAEQLFKNWDKIL